MKAVRDKSMHAGFDIAESGRNRMRAWSDNIDRFIPIRQLGDEFKKLENYFALAFTILGVFALAASVSRIYISGFSIQPFLHCIIYTIIISVMLFRKRLKSETRFHIYYFLAFANGLLNLFLLRLASGGLLGITMTIFMYFITFGMRAGIVSAIFSCSAVGIVALLDVIGVLPPVRIAPDYITSPSAWLAQGSGFILYVVLASLMVITLLRGLSRFFTDLKNKAKMLAVTNRQLEDKIVEKEEMASELALREERYRLLSENSNDVIFLQELDLSIRYISPSVQSFLGYSAEEAMKLGMEDIFMPDSFARMTEDFRKYLELAMKTETEVPLMEYEYRRKDGTAVWGELKASFLYDTRGKVSGVQGILRDVTRRKKVEMEHHSMEERLRQSEKLQAIGHLAGGIAHDFNNQLTGILGNAELIVLEHRNNPLMQKLAKEIVKSANNASTLVKQLLLFARKSEMEFIETNVHAVIDEVASILSRSIDKKITIRKTLRAIFPVIIADPVQLQNGLLNIAINARDAMPDGGTLVFSTDNVVIDEADVMARQYDPVIGSCVKISISDTGSGIPKENITKIFEPFFTTKETGTGMGLASVYGMVKTHKGHIDVESEPGKGSTFAIYMPISEKQEESAREKTEIARINDPCHVLLVDDEDVARVATRNMLEYYGIEVTDYKSGDEALLYFASHHDTIDLVILDQILPGISGSDLFVRMKHIQPEVKGILVSGYRFGDGNVMKLPDGMSAFVQKPFVIGNLFRTILDALAK